MDIVAQVVAFIACSVIFWRTDRVLNQMSRNTPFLVRVAFLLLLLASSSAIVFIILGDVPSWPAVIGSLGTACLLFCERRLFVLARPRKLQ